MRLKRLSLKNINSLEDFEIDFERFDSLFLISGPTGSGKTTIIDAILAALFDRTARLKYSKYLLNENSSSAEIVLEFEHLGNDYKIEWSVKRRKDIQAPKRNLYKNGVLIADKKDIQDELKKILKLDFEHFTKAIVLAQGEFDAFLKASSKDKAKVLEKVLDVKKYELISKKVFEKYKEKLVEFENLKEKIDLVKVDKVELAQKENELNTLKKDIENKKKRLKELEALLFVKREKDKFLESKKIVEKEINELTLFLDNLLKEKIEPVYQKELEEFERVFFDLFNDIEKKIYKKKEFLKKKKELEKFIGLEEKKDALLNELKLIEEEMNKTIVEEVENFDEIEEIFNSYFKLKEVYLREKKKEDNLLEELKKLNKNILENKLSEVEQKIASLEDDLLILKYEEDRKMLKENTPCPLCGALHHPFKDLKIDKKIKEEYNKLKQQKEELKKAILDVEVKEKMLSSLKENIQKLEEELKNIDLKGYKEEDFEELKLKEKENREKKEKLNKLSLKKVAIKKDLEKIEENLKIKTELQKELVAFDVKEDLEELEKRKKELLEKKEYLTQKAKKEKEKIAKIKELQKEKEINLDFKKRELKSIQEKLKSLMDVEVDEKEIENLKKELEVSLKKEGSLKEEIKNLSIKLKEFEKLNKQKKALEDELDILDRLNKKIGSKDGDKLKKIVINKQIETLLTIANIHLKKLTKGRYLLKRKDNFKEIELLVVDRFYANKQRDISTLSGGERFLTSLALSFALSDMVKENINIEFMFLDEGFGTLDLNTLLNVLDVIKDATKGKVVGIISHVEVLKEEIEDKIILG